MFSVTPVMEGEARGRRVSFSPDVDDSYRMNVIDKIKGLMDEVETIHRKEEKVLTKSLESDKWAFKQKQEQELQSFLKKQKEEAMSFDTFQVESRNNLRERQQNETLRLFGTTNTSGGWRDPGSASWQAGGNGGGGAHNGYGGNGASNNARPSVMDFSWNNGQQGS